MKRVHQASAVFMACMLVLGLMPSFAFASVDAADVDELATLNANSYDASTANTLTNNLEERFSVDGTDGSISNNTVYAAIALNSLEQGGNIDTSAVLDNMHAQDSEMTAGRMAKFIMILTAGGLDCTNYYDSDTQTIRNFVSEMEALIDPNNISVYDAVWILPVYKYGSYTQTAGMTESALIDFILSSTDEEGLFGYAQYGCDTQTTAQAILALLPYRESNTAVDAAITKAESTLLAYENADGSFGYSASYKDPNTDATAAVVCAIEALGYNSATSEALTCDDGSTPLGYLVSTADESLDGYRNTSAYDEPQTSAGVLLALAARDGSERTNVPYSVYTLQKVNRKVPSPAPTEDDPIVTPTPETDTVQVVDNTGSEKVADTKGANLAKTGDSVAGTVTGAMAVAFAAFGALCVAARKREMR